MTIQSDGTFNADTKEQVLDAMIADAKEYWGEDLKDRKEATIRKFYKPIAERFAISQRDIASVLASAQIDNAEGAGLDLLTALIGVRRHEAMSATGTITFQHKKDGTVAPRDYTIAEGTLIQTESDTPVRFETTESAILKEGNATVDVPIEAVEAGVNANVGANTIIVMPDPPIGVRAATNPSATSGGRDEEGDESLRSRAKESLGAGSRASATALVNTARALDGVKGVSIFLNDSSTDNTDSGGLPDHSFELVVQGGNQQDIADMILSTKAAGDNAYSGVNGTSKTAEATLPNGQTHPVSYSTPTNVKIYVDMDLKVKEEYAGDDDVRNSIVQYIGGILSSANDESGELLVGDDVLYGKVEYAVRDVRGVYDINSLTIGTSESPTGTSDIEIAEGNISKADATDGSITIATSEVSF
jgi:uncharacterized phage protein gp47/JayE